MIGVRDLTRHLLYIAKEFEYDNKNIYKSGFEKVVFIAYIYCLKYGIKMKYDVLFYKSRYGATSDEVKELLGNRYDRYDRYISYDGAKKLDSITDELNEKFAALIEAEAKNTFSMVKYIINSEVFQESEFNKLTEEGMSTSEYDYKVWCRDESVIWNLAEIYLLANVEIKEETDLRIPLSEKEYNAMMKYLELESKWVDNKDSSVNFTFQDILTLRCLSDSIIDSVRKHGAYLNK